MDLDFYRDTPLGVEAAWCPDGSPTLAVAVAAALLAGCALAPAVSDAERPSWLRDPARGEYPYNPRW